MSEINPPAVTVLIATYNKSAALRCAIQSVVWQTFTDWELWVVGDCCTDDSASVAASFGDERIHWHNLPCNSGYQSEPHNEGLRRARGCYIAYLNHDDLWLPDHLEVLVRQIEAHGADFAYSILEWVDDPQCARADIPYAPAFSRPPEASATLHRRAIVDELGLWKRPQDTYSVPRAEYFLRAYFIGKRFEMAPFLTVLKFGGRGTRYHELTGQTEFLAAVPGDPDLAHRRLGLLLAEAYHRLEQPVTLRAYISQVAESVRRWLVKRHIEPARLAFWRKPGSHIRTWRRLRKLS